MEDLVTSAKKRAVDGMEYFLRNFSHVPDDKLNWTPTPTAKSAIRVAAHTALYAGRFARMMRDRKLPSIDNLEEWLAQRNAEEIAITSRTEIESIFRKGTDEVLAALDALTPKEIESSRTRASGSPSTRTSSATPRRTRPERPENTANFRVKPNPGASLEAKYCHRHCASWRAASDFGAVNLQARASASRVCAREAVERRRSPHE